MRKNLNLRPNITLGLIFVFLANILAPLPSTQAQLVSPTRGEFVLPAPGVRVSLSPEFNPPILKGVKVHPDNPFRFDFILDKGDSPSLVKEGDRGSLKQEATRLIKYFLASLTIPEKDLWVNLSPYEKDRIVPQSFGQTEMGRDLLAEDYMLKQITASLIYPEDEIGKKFWKRIYEEAAKKFGTTDIPVNTFNKVWIVPEKAVVYENVKAGTAYVVGSQLKVMLEEDYLALEKNQGQPGDMLALTTMGHVPEGDVSPSALPNELGLNAKATLGQKPNDLQATSALGSQIVREIVIPELTKEVNEGKNFSQLRQMYNSLILATWYKKKIKDSILSQVYADKNKIQGLSPITPPWRGSTLPNELELNVKATRSNEPNDVELIYQRYLQAFKKGVYNYIKEDRDPITQETIPRKYFSGGTFLGNLDLKTSPSIDFAQNAQGLSQVDVRLDGLNERAYQNPVFIGGPGSNDRRSYLDRHYLQGQILHERILPYLIQRSLARRTRRGKPRLIISSLGASTAEELARLFYEVVVALEMNGQKPDDWDIKIDGFDKDPQKVSEGTQRIQNNAPFFRAIGDREQTSVDGRYYADLIMEKLNQYPDKFKESARLFEEDIQELPPDYLSGVDLMVLNHVLRDMDNHQAGALLRQLSKMSPQAIMAVGDLDRMLSHFEFPGRNHVFINSQMVSGKTAYYFGFPREVVGKIHLGDEEMIAAFDINQVNGDFLKGSTIIKAEIKSDKNALPVRGPKGQQFYVKIEYSKNTLLKEYLGYRIARRIGMHVPDVKLIGNNEITQLSDLVKERPHKDTTYGLVIQAAENYQPQGQSSGLEELVAFAYFMWHIDFILPDHNILRKKGKYIAYDLLTLFESAEESKKVDLIMDDWLMALNDIDINKLVALVKNCEQMDLDVFKDIYEKFEDLDARQALLQRQKQMRNDLIAELTLATGTSRNPKIEQLIESLGSRDSSQLAHQDRAMQKKGGIDLTPAHMNLQTKIDSSAAPQNDNEGIKFHLDPAMLEQLQNAPGFVPVIINIQPMTDLRQFLGIASLRSQ